MSNISNSAYIVDVFLDEGFLQWCGPEHWINDLPPEYPVWPTDADNADPCPLSSLQIGDYVRCPKHPTEHAPARVIGVDGHPYGFVCADCDALYTTTALILPPECVAPEDSERMVYA
ncbi:UNVERIFIED_ORG: hypothetical protein ABIC72_001641 [Burkholderia sp. 1988]|nr:hypothetical protein [Paraburkholderia terricola]